MTAQLSIATGEHGLVRLFAMDMPAEQAEFQREPGAAAQMLGTTDLDDTHVDIVRIADLDELGLSGYLITGMGIPQDQITPDIGMLSALTGHVMILRSSAFRGQAQDLTPDPRLSLIATYSESRTDWSASPMQTKSAEPFSAPRQSPREARSRARRIGATLFAVIMALIFLGLLAVIL
jgi:hypothetical protein